MWGPIALIGVPPVAAAVADAATGVDQWPWQLLVSGITPVAMVVLWLNDKLVSGRELQRVLEQLKQAREELAAERVESAKVQENLLERVIPAVVKQTMVLESIAPLLQTETHLRGRSPRDG